MKFIFGLTSLFILGNKKKGFSDKYPPKQVKIGFIW